MPTINQLIRKGRQDSVKLSKITCIEQRLQLSEEPPDQSELTAEAWCVPPVSVR